MGFFDDLGKKVTDVGQKTVQKTMDISETARINSQISQNERKIASLYSQIGKRYVDIHRNDCEEELKVMVESVTELEQKNFTYREQILEIKGVLRCENCGAEIQRGIAFCSSCGAPVRKTVREEKHNVCEKCSNCGALIEEGMRFCTECGYAVAVSETKTIQNQPDSIKSDDHVRAEETANVCSQCGAELIKDAVFCTECGHAVAVPETETTQNQEDPVKSDDHVRVEETVKTCSKCGAELMEDAVFCVECGHAVTQTTQIMDGPVILGDNDRVESGKVCHQCGTKLTDDSLFCSECGAKL